MAPQKPSGSSSSWKALALFYLLMLVIIAALDSVNGLLRLPYFLAQAGLLTVGVGVFAVVGWRLPTIGAHHSALLAFTIGVLTIVPAILMSLRQMLEGFWTEYFLVAFGMATGSLLAYAFTKLAGRGNSNRDRD